MAKINKCNKCGQFIGFTRTSELNHMCKPPIQELWDPCSSIAARYRLYLTMKAAKKFEFELMWGKLKRYDKNSNKIYRQ